MLEARMYSLIVNVTFRMLGYDVLVEFVFSEFSQDRPLDHQ